MFIIISENISLQIELFIWNSLPDSVIEANSVDSFKNRSDNHWNYFEFKYNWKADPTGPEAVVKVF